MVLLVEDDSAVRWSMTMGLVTQGLKVLEAVNGEQALQICETHPEPIDVVVTDIILPQMWGHELGRVLAVIRPDLPVVYVSGHSEEYLTNRGILTGIEHFLPKPFPSALLVAKLKTLLQRESAPAVIPAVHTVNRADT